MARIALISPGDVTGRVREIFHKIERVRGPGRCRADAPGCETGPGAQLVTWGKSTVCTVDAFGYKWQWTTNSSKHIPFDWTGP